MNPTALDILCSRGPWIVGARGLLTPAALRVYFTAIGNGVNFPAQVAFQVEQSHPLAQRAAQILKRAGLIEFGGRPPRRWVLTSLGRQVQGR